MITVLKEGKAHKRWAWFGACEYCGSQLRIIKSLESEKRDQSEEHHFNCDASMYYVDFVCPICGEKQRFHTGSSFGEKKNADYKEITLTPEEMRELQG